MNALKRYWGLTLSASLFSAVAAVVTWGIGLYLGYQAGLHAYDDLFLNDALAEIYYTDNPVDCPPCEVEETYEWDDVEPPLNNHLPEEPAFLSTK